MSAGYAAVRVMAPNDANGNPRRAWIVYDLAAGAQVAAVLTEGYVGPAVLADWERAHGPVERLDWIDVRPGWYRATITEARARGTYRPR